MFPWLLLLKLVCGAPLYPRLADPNPKPAWLGGLIAAKRMLGVLRQELRRKVDLWQSSCSKAKMRDEALAMAHQGLGAKLIRQLNEMVFPDVRSCLWVLCALKLKHLPSLRDQRGLGCAHKLELMSQVHTVGWAG